MTSPTSQFQTEISGQSQTQNSQQSKDDSIEENRNKQSKLGDFANEQLIYKVKPQPRQSRKGTSQPNDRGGNRHDHQYNSEHEYNYNDDENEEEEYEYEIRIQPPPGLSAIVPDGKFPANPYLNFVASSGPALQVFQDAMAIRLKVFCEEQQCRAEEELDHDDARSWSWVLYRWKSLRDNGEEKEGEKEEEKVGKRILVPVSTIRIVPPPHFLDQHDQHHPNGYVDVNEKPYIKLSRVATVAEARGLGLSKILLAHAWDFLAARSYLFTITTTTTIYGDEQEKQQTKWDGLVLTHAQVQVEGMYRKLGFVTDPALGRWVEEGIVHLGMWLNVDMDKS